MKRLVILMAFLLSAQLIFAGGPLKFRAGVIVLPANTWLLSTDFANDLTTYTPQLSWSATYGLATGIYFTDIIGVEVDFLFGEYTQKFKAKEQLTGQEFTYTTTMSVTDIPVLFKFSPGLMYLEAGPQYSLINKVENSGDLSGDVSNEYADNKMSFLAGGGIGVGIPKIAKIEAGVRFAYGFTDQNSGDDNSAFDSSLNSFNWGIKLSAVHEF